MQQGSAARVAVASSGAAVAPASLWILSTVRDFVLFVGPPFLILPIVVLAERLWSAGQMYLMVAAFGALGHHLPGMMRAYGDRSLFQRFRARFIFGPILLLGTCAGFAFLDPDMHAITLVAYGWGIWHGLMQLHGFLRIYDAKVKSFARLTARLDQWMCISWFGSGVIFSSSRLHFLFEAFYLAGGPAVPEALILGLRGTWGGLTAVVTLAYMANLLRQWRLGQPPNPVKLFALVTGIAFWLYCCLVVRNLLVGILMFELFHDVQYLAIVWLFNRKRVLSDPTHMGKATRAIFGRSQGRAVVYVGLVMAYGSLYFVEMLLNNWRPVDSAADATPVWGGILAASGLLHFYYDGFIWKVKEKPTRALLGLEGGREVQQGGRWWNRSWLRVPAWAEHGLNWAPFAVAIALFIYTHARPAMSENAARVTLGNTFPSFDLAQANLGMVLYSQGDLEGAIAANRRALSLRSTDTDQYAQIRNNLGWALVERAEQHLVAGEMEAATPLLQEALALEPAFADVLSNKATQALQAGNVAGAITKYRLALLMAPGHPGIQMNLALALGASGQVQEALAMARAAQRRSPQDPSLASLVARLEAAAPGGATAPVP